MKPTGRNAGWTGAQKHPRPPWRPVHPLWKQLRARRIERNLSQVQLADLAGWDLRSLNSWEIGATISRMDALENVANALGYELVLQEKER